MENQRNLGNLFLLSSSFFLLPSDLITNNFRGFCNFCETKKKY